MKQSSTGLVVSLVTFVILTVGLLASTIYFYIEHTAAQQAARNESGQRSAASDKARKAEEAFGELAGLVTGDAGASADKDVVKSIREALKVDEKSNVRTELDGLRADRERLAQENDSLKKQAKASEDAAKQAREGATKTAAAVDEARRKLEGEVAGYKELNEKHSKEVSDAVTAINRTQFEADQRHRTELEAKQRQLDEADASRQDLTDRIATLRESVDQYRIKPANAATLADGRVIDVSDADGQVFVSIGARQRVQPGMTFDVYESAEAIQVNPTTGEVVPGKARIQILKVESDTSTARVIPPDARSSPKASRPVLKDDVIANQIYSPDHRYKFLVHGKFDVDSDGRATAAEADYVRACIAKWGGQVIDGDDLRGDLDFVVMGVQPNRPADLAPNADAGAYNAYLEQKNGFESYERIFGEAQAAKIPVLNWNRMQVLTNEGR